MMADDPPITSSRRSPVRILCVEDNDPDYELVEEFLARASYSPGFELRRAVNLASAREQLLAAHGGAGGGVDIILLDLTLPDSEGEETFLEVQKTASEVAITVLTGFDDHDLGLSLVKLGAQAFLPKDELNTGVLLRGILHSIERKRNTVEMERLNHDLKSMQLQLIQAEKLESLGRLSAGVAHEIKNPLAMLQACVDFYKKRGAADDAETTILKTMEEAIERATRIVGGMLDFSRDEKLTPKLSNLNTLIHYAIDLVAAEMRSRGIEVIPELDTELPLVRLDPIKIEQILVNLLLNAMHASPDGARIKVRSYTAEVSNLFRNEGVRTLKHLRSGDDIVVAEVRDYGGGIPEDVLAKIFDPFFTTKATGKGTGLGLSVSKTIADLHGGILRIKNMNPPGVRAQLILPVELNSGAAHPSTPKPNTKHE